MPEMIESQIFTRITVRITTPSTTTTMAITASQRNATTAKEHAEKRQCRKEKQRQGLQHIDASTSSRYIANVGRYLYIVATNYNKVKSNRNREP